MKYPFNDPSLPLKERVKDLISRLTIEEKYGFIPTRNHAVERLGINAWAIGGEGAHGFVNREGNNTTFPQTIGLASSWDRDLLKKIGEVVGIEARCFYKSSDRTRGLAVWSPTVDLERDPRWGRTEEGYGEDPYLTSQLASQYIRGVQGDHPFYLRASCGPKHFFANNNEENRIACNCSIPPRLMYEYYLVPFKAAIKDAKAVSMMTAYNEVNGIPMMIHPIQEKIVKGEWGLEGHIVTDGGDFLQTVDAHHYFETHGETLAAALKSGADSMTDMPEPVIEAVKEALERNLIDEAEIDRHLERIFAIRFRFGQFDPIEEGNQNPYEAIGEADYMKEEYKKLSLEAVRKSIVLLKNENSILPIVPEKTNGTIAVMGPLAAELHLDWYAGIPTYQSTSLEALKKTYGEKIEFTDCRDIVSFTTDDGRPLILIDVPEKDNPDKTKKTLAAGKPQEKPASFYVEDWGWGVKTFTDTQSGLILEGCYARREVVPPRREPIPPQLMPKNDTTDYFITASAKNNLQWFGFTLFNIVPQGNGNILIKTHDNRRIIANETGTPVTQHDDPVPVKGELFKMKLERDGLIAAKEAAAKARHVLFFAGNDPMINGRECIDRPSLNLPPRHEQLIENINDVNKNTVLVMISGYPYTIKEISKKLPAIIWMAHGIQETGNGIADVLSGKYSPAGRTPLTWYEDEKQLPSIMEYDIMAGKTTYQYFNGNVLYPFGHGLSYTNFEYKDLKIDKTLAGKDDIVNISFKVKNTGSVSSEEVAQMYVTFKGSDFQRSLKTLKSFDRILLAAGEEKIVNFELKIEELAIWESFNERFLIESGSCSCLIGASSADIRLTGGFEVKGEKSLPRKLPASVIFAKNFDTYCSCFLHEKRGSDIPAVFNNEDGAWIKFMSLDFETGKKFKLSAVAQGRHDSRIEIRLDSPEGQIAGVLNIPITGDISFYPLPQTSFRRLPSWGHAECKLENINGARDLYFVFYGKTGLWQFEFN
ncbi:MAG: glycoside hydrolase family 3 C-terminal domain-containing protein [Treponema sp.]|nr:glycoside hydrolase family 3 C-terminal domain-containing protein [Treponema sp.]